MKTMFAIGYGRTSRHTNVLSLETQRKQCEEWCARTGTSLLAWKHDAGVSGATPLEERAGLTDALRMVRAHQNCVLVVASRDRLARDVDAAGRIEREVMLAGGEVISAEADSEVTRSFCSQILEAVAMYQRELGASLSETVAPFGYRLVRDEHEQAILSEITRLLESGRSCDDIADVLNQYTSCRGGRWSGQTVEAAFREANMPCQKLSP